jgi:hypothetical protein
MQYYTSKYPNLLIYYYTYSNEIKNKTYIYFNDMFLPFKGKWL